MDYDLIIENISFTYEKRHVLKEVSLRLKKGEIGTLIGASGSGKSTLFKLLTGLLRLQSGEFQVGGLLPPHSSKHIAYMMQQDMLLPWRDALNNITLVTELGGKSSIDIPIQHEALQLLEEMGLADSAYLYPNELSGGMRQRVSLARALLQKRPLLLLDEPFGALDVGLREQMYRMLRQIREKRNTTMLMVTHDFRDALSLSDRLFLLSHGRITREWTITHDIREDFEKMGQLHNELKSLLI